MADRRIAREQLDRKFTANPAGALAARPKFGWLRAVRDSLGMTTAQLAVRAGVTPAAITKAEQSERNQAIQLSTLARLADAMNCDLVYYLAPRAGTLSAAVDEQTDVVAAIIAKKVAHSMALEDQSVGNASIIQQVRESLSLSGKIW